MKKKTIQWVGIITTICMILGCFSFFIFPNPTPRININKYEIKRIIKSFPRIFRRIEKPWVDKSWVYDDMFFENNGDEWADDFGNRIDEWADDFGDRIELWANDLSNNIEEWANGFTDIPSNIEDKVIKKITKKNIYIIKKIEEYIKSNKDDFEKEEFEESLIDSIKIKSINQKVVLKQRDIENIQIYIKGKKTNTKIEKKELIIESKKSIKENDVIVLMVPNSFKNKIDVITEYNDVFNGIKENDDLSIEIKKDGNIYSTCIKNIQGVFKNNNPIFINLIKDANIELDISKIENNMKAFLEDEDVDIENQKCIFGKGDNKIKINSADPLYITDLNY